MSYNKLSHLAILASEGITRPGYVEYLWAVGYLRALISMTGKYIFLVGKYFWTYYSNQKDIFRLVVPESENITL